MFHDKQVSSSLDNFIEHVPLVAMHDTKQIKTQSYYAKLYYKVHNISNQTFKLHLAELDHLFTW